MDADITNPLQSHSATSTIAAQDPPTPPPEPHKTETPQEDHPPETPRESKRRRLCPAALDKCGEVMAMNNFSNSSACFSNSSFSFSFDPKFSFGVSTPEVTPKFGSFKLVPEEEGAASKSGDEDGENKEKKDDDDGIGITTGDYLEEGSS